MSSKGNCVELTVHGSDRAQPLQDEFSRVYRERIISLMDRCFSEFSDPDTLDRIDLLELDLGHLDVQNLESDLVERVETALRRQLESLIDRSKHEHGVAFAGQDARSRSQLELFECFALTGTLPWWVDSSSSNLLAENLSFLVSESPAAFRELGNVLIESMPIIAQRV